MADTSLVTATWEAFMQRYRKLAVSLGWLAAFVMAVGAGWKH
jgi:hypothetical protein